MALLAKRVSASSAPCHDGFDFRHAVRARGIHHLLEDFAACWTSSGIRAPDFDLAEARGAGAVAGAHHLLGLALAAVGHAPQRPMLAARQWPRRRSRIPW